jgi:hypothetical protein
MVDGGSYRDASTSAGNTLIDSKASTSAKNPGTVEALASWDW